MGTEVSTALRWIDCRSIGNRFHGTTADEELLVLAEKKCVLGKVDSLSEIHRGSHQVTVKSLTIAVVRLAR